MKNDEDLGKLPSSDSLNPDSAESADVRKSRTKDEVKRVTDVFRNTLVSSLPDHTKALKSSKLVANEKLERLSSRVRRGLQDSLPQPEEIELKPTSKSTAIGKITGIDDEAPAATTPENGVSAMVNRVNHVNLTS